MPTVTKSCRLALGIFAALVTTSATAQSMSRGVLLSSTPIAGAPSGADAFRIRYQSRAVGGERNQVTGVIIVPEGMAPRDGRNVIAWAHGTSGVAESCAPSQSKALFGSIAGLNEMLAAGYAVVATDYAGLGTPGPHPYLVGNGSAYSVLDSIRAAREFGRGSNRQSLCRLGRIARRPCGPLDEPVQSKLLTRTRTGWRCSSGPTDGLERKPYGRHKPSDQGFAYRLHRHKLVADLRNTAVHHIEACGAGLGTASRAQLRYD